MSGFIFGFILLLLSHGVPLLLGAPAAKVCFVYVPLALGAFLAVVGTLWPERATEYLGSIWQRMHTVVRWLMSYGR